MTSAALDPLSQLAIRHGTDKYGEHLYTPEYHRLFAHLRDRPIRLLEIGVGGYGAPDCGGQSLRMWAEYFPLARITGLDISEKRLALPPRVAIRQGAQGDPAVLDRLWHEDGPFDIVIDDGSHRTPDILASFHALYPRMAEGCIYAVEDTQTAFWRPYGGDPHAHGTIFELAYRVTLSMHTTEMEVHTPLTREMPYGDITREVRFLRNLVVFERGPNTYPSNYGFDTAHPEVAAVIARLEAAMQADPTPGPWLTLAKMHLMAGQARLAEQTAAAGLGRFPGHPDLTQVLGKASRQAASSGHDAPGHDAAPDMH